MKRLVLLATWTDLQEEIITDNEIHSDLDPLEAPAWSVGVQFEDRPQCLMSKLSLRLKLLTFSNVYLGTYDSGNSSST